MIWLYVQTAVGEYITMSQEEAQRAWRERRQQLREELAGGDVTHRAERSATKVTYEFPEYAEIAMPDYAMPAERHYPDAPSGSS